MVGLRVDTRKLGAAGVRLERVVPVYWGRSQDTVKNIKSGYYQIRCELHCLLRVGIYIGKL